MLLSLSIHFFIEKFTNLIALNRDFIAIIKIAFIFHSAMTVIVLKLQSANLTLNLVLFATVPNTLGYRYVHPNMVMMPSLNPIVVNYVIRPRTNFF